MHRGALFLAGALSTPTSFDRQVDRPVQSGEGFLVVTCISQSNPAVSVIIPAYNRAKTIGRAIESVLRQTWRDLEIIVVDDGSTDSTLAEAAKLNDLRIRLLQNARNLGAAGARNAGVAKARGTWIAFQDSDDEWLPYKLEKQMARLMAPGANYVGAYCGLLTLGHIDQRSGERLKLSYVPRPSINQVEGNILDPLLHDNIISTQTLVVRLDVFRAIGGLDVNLPAIEDWDLAIRLAATGPIAFVDEPLVQQHFSPNSLTRDMEKRLHARILLVEKNKEAFSRKPALLARQYQIIANGFRDRGDLAQARRQIALACRIAPFNPRILAHAAEIFARSLLLRNRS